MNSLGTGVLLLAFMGITGLTVALVFYQHMKIKEFDLRQRAKEEAEFEASIGPAATN